MSKTASLAELLQVCLWDLRAGCDDLSNRLPSIASKASDAHLRSQLEDVAAKAKQRAERLEAVSNKSEGPPNIWMCGILDDGQRDTRSVEEGVLLDLALIGAIRKALVAELASIATAKSVAASLADDPAIRALASNATDVRQEDAALQDLLATFIDA